MAELRPTDTTGAFEAVDTVIHLAGESVNGRGLAPSENGSWKVGGLVPESWEAIADSTPPNLISSSAIASTSRADTRLTEASTSETYSYPMSALPGRMPQSAAQSVPKLACFEPDWSSTRRRSAGRDAALFGKVSVEPWLRAAILVVDSPRRLDICSLFCSRKKLEGPINFVGPSPVPQKEFAKTLASVLSRPAFCRPALRWRGARHHPA